MMVGMSLHSDRLEKLVKRAARIDPLAGEALRKAARQIAAEEVARRVLSEELELEGAVEKSLRAGREEQREAEQRGAAVMQRVLDFDRDSPLVISPERIEKAKREGR